MPISLQCPNLTCRAIMRVPEKVRGKKVRCGKCGLTFVIPAAPTPKVDAAPKPEK